MYMLVECVMEKLLLARDSNRVITEINHVEHAWELHSHTHTQTHTTHGTAYLHQHMHTYICKGSPRTHRGHRKDYIIVSIL